MHHLEIEHVLGANLADFIGRARNLTTLTLAFGGAMEHTAQPGRKGVLEICIRVVGLKRLGLRDMDCRESTLQTIILNNADTVRSLELGCIHLLSDSSIEECPGPSWVVTIRFLQSTLDLDYVALNGVLSNGSAENWNSHPPDECTAQTGTDFDLYHGEK